MDFKVKWLYKHCSFSVFLASIPFFPLSSAPHHSTTLAFPSSTSQTILAWLYAASLSSLPLNLIFFKYVSKGSDCLDSNNGAIGI